MTRITQIEISWADRSCAHADPGHGVRRRPRSGRAERAWPAWTRARCHLCGSCSHGSRSPGARGCAAPPDASMTVPC